MNNFDILSNKFNCYVKDNKIFIKDNLVEILEFLKNTPEYDFDILTSMIAIDYKEKIEIIYLLYSSKNNFRANISLEVMNNSAPSVVSVYKSAYFEECEIYDMFGVNFVGNEKLKRLFMPESWVGHPMLKSYVLDDERLAWND